MAKSRFSTATWYADFRRIMGQEISSPVQKMLKRRNSRVSRSHRLEAALVPAQASASEIRSAMLAMASIARTTRKPELRDKAIAIYDECAAALREVDLQLGE